MNVFSTLLSREPFPLFLAPMEGVTDTVFRKLCKDFGANFLVSEFISSDALIREVEQSLNKMRFSEQERPFGVQIFGHDENSLSRAAARAAEVEPDFIDINWGCPVKKVVSKGAGAAILQDIPKMIKLTRSVVRQVSLPVTVKTRIGWDTNNIQIVEIAERLQDIGIQAITIHGRTRAQQYGGKADWTWIAKVKNNPSLHIPVIGNGDIASGQQAIELQKESGVDALMIGRAAMGNPWIFAEIKHAFLQKPYSPPTYKERVHCCLCHLQDTSLLKGERRAVLETRAHYAGYFKGIPFFKEKKNALMRATTVAECRDILTLDI